MTTLPPFLPFWAFIGFARIPDFLAVTRFGEVVARGLDFVLGFVDFVFFVVPALPLAFGFDLGVRGMPRTLAGRCARVKCPDRGEPAVQPRS